MEVVDKIKVAFVAFFTAINSFLGVLAIPVYMLVGASITDYLTGIAASNFRGEPFDKHKGIRGIATKVCTWLLVGIGYILDYSIIQISALAGIDIKVKCLIAVAVTFWLIANELISILENVSDIGVELPPFLMKFAQLLKGKTETAVDSENVEVKINKE